MSTHLPQPPPDDDADPALPADDQPPGGSTGKPPPPNRHSGRESEKEPYDSTGVTGLVCGIAGLVLAMIPIMNLLTWPLGMLAIVFGSLSWSRSKNDPAINRNTAIFAIVLGAASFFITCGVYAGADPTNAPGVQGMLGI